MDHDLSDVLQVGFDDRAGCWWLSCPGCDGRRTIPEDAELASAMAAFLEQHRSCH